MILTSHDLSEIAEKLDAIDCEWHQHFLSTDAAIVAYRSELEEMGVKFPKPGKVIHSSRYEPATVVDDTEPDPDLAYDDYREQGCE
jgi:hypothetical protein